MRPGLRKQGQESFEEVQRAAESVLSSQVQGKQEKLRIKVQVELS